jgi:hypothetical protein
MRLSSAGTRDLRVVCRCCQRESERKGLVKVRGERWRGEGKRNRDIPKTF